MKMSPLQLGFLPTQIYTKPEKVRINVRNVSLMVYLVLVC